MRAAWASCVQVGTFQQTPLSDTTCHNDATFLSPSYRQTHNKLMHCDTASNYDMLMGTQCTICLSSDHSERAPQRPPLSFSFHFFSPTPSTPSSLLVGSRGEARIEPTSWLHSLCACFLLLLPLPSFKTFKSPEATSFPLSSLSLSFFHFLPLDPDSSYEK